MTDCEHGGKTIIKMTFFGTPNTLNGCDDCNNLIISSDNCEVIS